MKNDHMRRWLRQEYLRQHQEQRRAADKAAGARRIDVTLRGDMLDDFAVVRGVLEGLDQSIPPGALKKPLIRLSDTEVIRFALHLAVSALQDEDWLPRDWEC